MESQHKWLIHCGKKADELLIPSYLKRGEPVSYWGLFHCTAREVEHLKVWPHKQFWGNNIFREIQQYEPLTSVSTGQILWMKHLQLERSLDIRGNTNNVRLGKLNLKSLSCPFESLQWLVFSWQPPTIFLEISNTRKPCDRRSKRNTDFYSWWLLIIPGWLMLFLLL